MVIKSRDCKARQHSDQMRCDACGLAWDVCDPDPPICCKDVTEATAQQRRETGSQAIEKIRQALASTTATPGDQPLPLRELPLKWLPAFGLAECLMHVNWTSMPEASYAHVKSVHSQIGTPGRIYTFFTKTGTPVIEVEVFDDYDSRRCSVRHYVGPGFGEWQCL
ncbi:hypothetical protein [Pseudomonas citronellolis]|uniref:hypothetical protein n=1 Tax=Pseudomonas citronellolis TaxID=53408 RepID=UPI00248E2736|nr:hypothetical protein [Pseudomonas citronellolis]